MACTGAATARTDGWERWLVGVQGVRAGGCCVVRHCSRMGGTHGRGGSPFGGRLSGAEDTSPGLKQGIEWKDGTLCAVRLQEFDPCLRSELDRTPLSPLANCAISGILSTYSAKGAETIHCGFVSGCRAADAANRCDSDGRHRALAGGQGRQANEDRKGRLAELERALRDSEAKVW